MGDLFIPLIFQNVEFKGLQILIGTCSITNSIKDKDEKKLSGPSWSKAGKRYPTNKSLSSG